jgi:hypothetical protein
MFKFLVGVAFGAAGYWAWQSFGRDLLGLGSDQDTYSTYSSNTSFGGTNTGYGSSTSSPSSTGAGTSSSESPTSASS